jgi:hypothetical protein
MHVKKTYTEQNKRDPNIVFFLYSLTYNSNVFIM